MSYKKIFFRCFIIVFSIILIFYSVKYLKVKKIIVKQTIGTSTNIVTNSQSDSIYYIEPENIVSSVTASETPPTTEQSINNDSDTRYIESLSDTVVIGDSIALGFSYYKLLKQNKVLATGGLAARNIREFKFSYSDSEYHAIDMMSALIPEYIIMSMGMNDVNITTKEEFIQNYKNNINSILELSPNSKIMVLSITPVGNTNFTSNEIIDAYNNELKYMIDNFGNTQVIYVDVNSYLKNPETNSLDSQFESGDGIHLGPEVYECFIPAIEHARILLTNNN